MRRLFSIIVGLFLLDVAVQAVPYLNPPKADGESEAIITSAYGPRDINEESYFHRGVDYRHPFGTTVKPLEAGTIQQLRLFPDSTRVELEVLGTVRLKY